MRDRLFWFSGILGVGALAMTAMLTFIGPRQTGPLPPGFITPIMAFEFIDSPAEVSALFETPAMVAAMDRVNRWDFLYMALYASFLGVFALACARQTGQRFYYVPAILAAIILLADALENVHLLAITRVVSEADFAPSLSRLSPLLNRLRLFTWLKWGSLALYFLLMVAYFRQLPGRWRNVWLVALLPAVLAVAALFRRGLPNELMALSIGLMFLILTIYALRVGSEGERAQGRRGAGAQG